MDELYEPEVDDYVVWERESWTGIHRDEGWVYFKGDKVEWGQYDDMFPTQVSNKYEEVKLDPDDSLEDYFDSFYYFLMQVGFTKRDIDSTARKYF